MRIFISHAWEDKPLALELMKLPAFINPWVDIRELAGGQELDPTIQLAIEESHVFITLLSQHSTVKAWVEKELEWALQREEERDRVFVLPVIIDPDLRLEACPGKFGTLATRLTINATDTTETGLQASRMAIAQTLFQWTCDWLEELEPKGNSGRQFVEKLERDLKEYQKRLFAVKAVLSWPLNTIVKPDSVAHLIETKDAYNEFSGTFLERLIIQDDEVRWRFGKAAQRSFSKLSHYIRDEVYHGAAYALNDVIESINSYVTLSQDPEALAAAEARRIERIEQLEPVMDELVDRTSDFIDIVKQ